MDETYPIMLFIFLGGALSTLNLLFFLLAARQNVWAWVAGGLCVAVSCSFMLLSPAAQIFAASRIFQLIVELLLFAYGAFLWHKNGHRFFNQPAAKCFPVSSLLKQYFAVREQVVLAAILLAAILLLSRSSFSYLNLVIYAISLALITHKKVEGWALLAISEVLRCVEAIAVLQSIDLYIIGSYSLKVAVFVYGFVYWKSKLDKKEEIEAASLSSMAMTGVLSLVYIAAAFIVPFALAYVLTSYVCKGGGGCSGIPAGLFMDFFVRIFPLLALVVAIIILFVKKERFRQWQLFFLANGLFGMEVLDLFRFSGTVPVVEVFKFFRFVEELFR